MRTKTTLAAAAILAAGLASSMAQNVYSLNVVGYVNVTVKAGQYNFLCNPLNNTAGNNLTNLFSGTQPNTSQVLKWDANAGDFQLTQPIYSGGAWSANVSLPVGEGFFYAHNGATDFTQTFVGDVVQGSFTNALSGSGNYNAVGASVPEGGSFINAISGLVPANTDQVLKWDGALGDFATPQPIYSGGAWSTTALTINPAEGFFYARNGASVNWVRNFTVAP